jgi:hypothetical protein
MAVAEIGRFRYNVAVSFSRFIQPSRKLRKSSLPILQSPSQPYLILPNPLLPPLTFTPPSPCPYPTPHPTLTLTLTVSNLTPKPHHTPSHPLLAVTEYCVLPIGSDDIRAAMDPEKAIKSIMFYGPSGTGKTLAVEAVSHELGALMIHLTPGRALVCGFN